MDQGPLFFVVHKHRARSLHYDLRLEVQGEIQSWSVPKGLSMDHSVKRLAMPTGPHKLEYRHFEGVIPGGSPGTGAVMIWDQGTYTPEVESWGVWRAVEDRREADEVAASGLRDGNLKFTLFGQKLAGSFALVRTRGLDSKEAWLVIKHRDAHCRERYDANEYDFSAETGRSLVQIFEEARGTGQVGL